MKIKTFRCWIKPILVLAAAVIGVFWAADAWLVIGAGVGAFEMACGCGCGESCAICCAPALPSQLKVSLSGSTGTYTGAGTCPGNCSDYDADYIVDLDSAAQYAIDGHLPGCCRENTAAVSNCKWRSPTFSTPCYYGLFDNRRFFVFVTSSGGVCRIRAGFDFESFAGNACAASWVASSADVDICSLPVTLAITTTGGCSPHPCAATFGTLTIDLP